MTHDRMRAVLATTNAGKVRELAGPLADFGVDVVGLDHFPHIGDIVEDGLTFEENALIKARTVANITGLVSLADDSGLEVDALDGAPGIHSARYGNDWELLPDESRDDRNIRKLLHVLRDVPEDRRACRFVSCMAVVRPAALGGGEMVVRGTWDGRLLTARRGSNGFGYDPIFFDPRLGRTAAELSREEKHACGHRGNALRALLARWEDFMRGADGTRDNRGDTGGIFGDTLGCAGTGGCNRIAQDEMKGGQNGPLFCQVKVGKVTGYPAGKRISGPGMKTTLRWAGMYRVAPVCGFRPGRALNRLT